MTFVEMGLAEPVLRAVTAEGYINPTPIQAAAIPAAMSGRDLLGCAQTGTGKTAAFALPILHRLYGGGASSGESGKKSRGFRRIRCLILSPTRELAIQIGESLRVYGAQTGVRHTVIVGGVGQSPQVHALQKGIDILVATPGRLEDLRQQGYIDLRAVEIFVLDEADRMLDMGFLPSIRKIVKMLPDQKQTLFFSATMPGEIAELADGILHNPERIRIAPVKQTTELVTHSVYHVSRPQKSRLLATLLKNQPIARAIVFCRTKHGADRLANQLEKYSITTAALHGDKSQTARQKALAQFKSSSPPVLVATDVAARGIDVDSVSHVFNFDLPNETETYVHRIGRTGRAGATGLAISFCDDGERGLLKQIERHIKQTIPVETIGELIDPPPRTDPPAGSADTAEGDQRTPREGQVAGESEQPRGQRPPRDRGPRGDQRGQRGDRNNSGNNRFERRPNERNPRQASFGQVGQRQDRRRQDPQAPTDDRPRKEPRYVSSRGRE
ncbi:MAG: DEAD/DEAH box helicase [Planctomycetota bacterium]|nr:MAG: DEAD/DEAH box helicase [Planctomycetota bacterium]